MNLVNSVQPFGLALDILGLVLVVVGLLTDQELLLERLLGVLVGRACTASGTRCGATGCLRYSPSSVGCFAGFRLLIWLHSKPYL